MTQVQILVYGDEVVARELDLIGARGESMLGIWPAIQERMEEIEREQFASDGARGPSGPWPDYEQPSTWQWYKFQAGLSLELMRATHATEEALTSETPDSVRLMTDDTFAFGADLDQFRIQQDWSPDNDFPERRPIDFTPRDELAFAETIMGWVTGSVNAAGQRINPATGHFAKGGSILR